MSYPDDFSSARFRDAHERRKSLRADENDGVAASARAILVAAASALAALPSAPGSRTAEMIDEAVAWMDEQSTSIRVAADLEAQDL